MGKRILVPVDGSPQSEAALSFALEEWPDASVTLLNVIDPVEAGYRSRALPGSSEEWFESEKRAAEQIFEDCRDRFGAAFDTRVEVGRPSRAIVETVSADEFDLVVLGSHGREGVSRILLGSVAEHVVRRSPVPVTVVRGTEDET